MYIVVSLPTPATHFIFYEYILHINLGEHEFPFGMWCKAGNGRFSIGQSALLTGEHIGWLWFGIECDRMRIDKHQIMALWKCVRRWQWLSWQFWTFFLGDQILIIRFTKLLPNHNSTGEKIKSPFFHFISIVVADSMVWNCFNSVFTPTSNQ